MVPGSLVTQFSPNDGAPCGYCSKSNTANSNGMHAYNLTVSDYQNLIDRGWRRSGTYCYKPTANATCCPPYTIKCDITNFSFSKSHKKNLKQFHKFIRGEEATEPIAEEEPKDIKVVEKNQPAKKSAATYTKGVGPDPSKGVCKKAKLIRLEKREEKLKSKGITTNPVVKNTPKSQEKSIEDIISELPEDSKKKLKIRLVLSSSKNSQWKEAEIPTYNLYLKYQITIHKDTPEKCTKRQFERFLVESPLQIKYVSIGREDVNCDFHSSIKLYKKYQTIIHNDKPEECDEESFMDFLVKTPFTPETQGNIEYGSFHQQYWLDDKLIAVGVLDILPKCVSSVYFFYDPDLHNFSLGTYGALREISFTRDLHQRCPDINHYYMGFYIHTCPKMKYKGNFQPSYLLCPETYKWFPLEQAVGVIAKKGYARLNPDLNAEDADKFVNQDINNIPVYLDRKVILYWQYKILPCSIYSIVDEDLLQIYGKLAGKDISKKIIHLL